MFVNHTDVKADTCAVSDTLILHLFCCSLTDLYRLLPIDDAGVSPCIPGGPVAVRVEDASQRLERMSPKDDDGHSITDTESEHCAIEDVDQLPFIHTLSGKLQPQTSHLFTVAHETEDISSSYSTVTLVLLISTGAVLAQNSGGGALLPSAPSSRSPFSPFSDTEKIRTSYRPT